MCEQFAVINKWLENHEKMFANMISNTITVWVGLDANTFPNTFPAMYSKKIRFVNIQNTNI